MKLVPLPETAEAFERRLDWQRRDATREATARALAFCRGCMRQYDSRQPCPVCAAFRAGVPHR